MIIFLYGEDTYRSRQKLNELKEKFRREVDPAGNSLLTIDGAGATMAKISEAVGTSSLFAKKRMIVIERLFSQKSKSVLEQMRGYLVKSSELGAAPVRDAKKPAGTATGRLSGNILIFWEDAGEPSRHGTVFWQELSGLRFAQNFKKLSNTATADWIKAEVAKRGGKIKPAAAARLASLTGGDLWQLKNEIDKLISFKEGQGGKLIAGGSETAIEAADVESLVKGQLDENIFALTDAIGNNNKAEALRRFEEELAADVAESYLFHMITRQFRILLTVRQSLDKGLSPRQIASRLKIHPFVAQKSLNQVRNFSLPALKNIFSRLVQADKAVKTGQTDAKTALTMLLAKI